MLNKSFKPAKCKTALNLAKSRMKLLKNKKEIQVKQLNREVAQLLQSDQDQTARIRVEHVVREEKTMAAYELIEIYCELIVARLPIIESQKNCPLDLKEAITSLIFAAPRCGDIPELQDVRKHFTAKYGKEFVSAAVELRPECGVSRIMVEKLSVKAPDGPTKVKILTAIAEEHNFKWEPKWFKDEDPAPPVNMLQQKASQVEKAPKIQMEPLNFQLADDLEKKHAHDTRRPETSSHSNAHANTDANKVPPTATSHPAASPLGSFQGRMTSSQSSEVSDDAFYAGRPNWNMEFKDATTAAQAAAESAERASMAARAAAELSIRSKIVSDASGPLVSSVHDSSKENRVYAGSILQHKDVERDSVNSSFNQRSAIMLGDQGFANEKSNMKEGSDVQYDSKRQDDKASENSSYFVHQDMGRQSRDSFSNPTTSNAESNMFQSSHRQEFGNRPVEIPFHEETVEMINEPNSFQSQSTGIFSNLNDRNNKNDSGDGPFDSFNQGSADDEDWHVRTAHHAGFYDGKGAKTFQERVEGESFLGTYEKKYDFDSDKDIFVGMDHSTSERDVKEIGSHRGTAVVFDESDADDDEGIFDPSERSLNFPAPVESSPGDSSLHQDDSPGDRGSQSYFNSHRHFEPDLSESFRRSPIYSKLVEPLPVTFDDSDGASSGDGKELLSEKTDSSTLSNDYRKPDIDSRVSTELVKSSYVEKASDSFATDNRVDKKESTYSDNAVDSKFGSSYLGTHQPSVHSLVDEDKPQKSPRSSGLSLQSRDHLSEFEYETVSRPGGGMELNLGVLPGGRRNRPHWRPPYTRGSSGDFSFSSRSSKAAADDAYATSDQTSPTLKFDDPSTRMEKNQSEVAFAQDGSTNVERPYNVRSQQNMHITNSKGYFDSDDSSSEEDVPRRPVVGKTLPGAGLSRRTKERGRSSSSSRATQVSPKLQTPTDPSRWDEQATSGPRPQSKVSKEDESLSSSVVERPVNPSEGDEAPIASKIAPSRENSSKTPSHVHPKLPDFETLTAHLQSLRISRQ